MKDKKFYKHVCKQRYDYNSEIKKEGRGKADN
jgi:hypothetical protein